ncbi:MAG TPA: hypothetical protein VEA40_16830 [Ramlibacter sp.]|nr:hypothetical protein [Ramlibacter sp.]
MQDPRSDQQPAQEQQQPAVPDTPGPHDVPDDEVIEKTLPARS